MLTIARHANLVDLSPLTCLLLHEPCIDSRHNLIEVLAAPRQHTETTRKS